MKKLILYGIFMLQGCVLPPHHGDKHLLQLRYKNSGTQILQEKNNSSTRIVFPNSAAFKPKSAVLSPQLMALLDELVNFMRVHPSYIIIIHGYTDSIETAEANLVLSKKRSFAAIRYLESQGISLTRFLSRGHGTTNPRYPASQDNLNRRIEITLHTVNNAFIKD